MKLIAEFQASGRGRTLLISLTDEERIPSVGEHVWVDDEELQVVGVELARGLKIRRDQIGLIVRSVNPDQSRRMTKP